MKKKIRIIDLTSDKILEEEVSIRDLDHLEAQKKFKANVFKPKKGKGSFKRNKKVEEERQQYE